MKRHACWAVKLGIFIAEKTRDHQSTIILLPAYVYFGQ